MSILTAAFNFKVDKLSIMKSALPLYIAIVTMLVVNLVVLSRKGGGWKDFPPEVRRRFAILLVIGVALLMVILVILLFRDEIFHAGE